MKKIISSFALFVLILALAPFTLRASHIVGMDLTYAYNNAPNSYIVTLKYYSDCDPSSIPPPTQITICYSSASCGLNGSATFTAAAPGQVPIPPCIPNPGATTCNGGTAYGVWEVIFSGPVLLPQACNDWVFSYSDCCRNGQISTLLNPANQGISIKTTLDNFNYPTNSSPTFSNPPVTQFCVFNQFYFDQGASDVDGDSLAFFLAAPQDGGTGCPAAASYDVTYNPGYSDSIPFDSQNGVTIDNATGIVSFIPSVQQIGVMAVLVKEYRNGIEIGHISRDIQIKITSQCAVNPPVPATFLVTLGGANYNGVGVQCGDSSVILTFPTTPVQCKSIEPNGTDFRILAPNGQPNPAISAKAINCYGGVTDSILIHFYYPLKYGITYMWTKLGNDGNTLLSECGSPIAEYDTVKIILEDTSHFSILTTANLPCAFDSVTLNFSEVLDCYSFAPNGTDLILVDAAGTQFAVSNAYGIGCNVNNPNSSLFHFQFSQVVNGISPYYLISLTGTDSTTVSNQCGRFVHPGDTIAILIVSNSLPISLGADTTVCSSDPLPVLNAGLTGASYVWTINGSLGGVNQTQQATGPGTYSVQVTVGPNCIGSDTVQVNVIQAPQLILNNISICDYDPLPVLNAQNPGATYQWTLNGNPLGTGQTQATTGPGTYAVTISVGTSCNGNSSMVLTVNPKPTPLVSDTTLCTGGTATLSANGGPTDLVFWYSDTVLIASTPTLSVDSSGVYIGVLQTVDGCRNSDTATVKIEFPLEAPKVNCGAGNSTLKYIYSWNSIPNATGYLISTDGGITFPASSLQTDTFYGSNTQITGFYVIAQNTNSTCKDGAVSDLAPCEVIIPNVITPNGDGNNDVFFIKNLDGHPGSSLKVMNRWGNSVLNDSNYQNNWSGDKLSDGTYYYILKLDDGKEYTGTITIIHGK